MAEQKQPSKEAPKGEKKQSRRGFYIILVLVLLAINGLLFFSTFQNKRLNDQLEAQRQEAEAEITRLNREIDEYILTLDTYKTENEEIIAMRDSLKQVIFQKQKEIERQINTKNFTVKSLDETKALLASARLEIESLKQEMDGYVVQLDSVRDAYMALQVEYDTLTERYGQEVRRSVRLQGERDSIAGLGAILQAINVDGTGVRAKKNGEEEEQKRAKKAEKIRVCFDLLENRLLGDGTETLYLKIVSPAGITLAVESLGSGIFLNRDNGEESMYTNRYQLEIGGGGDKRYCVYWAQPSEYLEGTYTAEVFHKGYLIGETSFELK